MEAFTVGGDLSETSSLEGVIIISTELEYARNMVGSAIWAPEHYIDVITLACAATYKIDDLENAARIISLGNQGSGKSTVLTVASYLAANTTAPTGVLGMTAPSYVADYRMMPNWTPLIDEVNHLFGLAGNNGTSSKFYTYLNQGYNRATAWAQQQEKGVPLRIPIFGFAFLAGRGLACPADLRDRGVVLLMEKAPAKTEVADFALPETRDAFAYAGNMLASWASRLPKLDVSAVRELHPKLNHRTLEVWGSLFAVAMAADGGERGEWTERCLVAFERLELNSKVPVYAPEDQLLADYLLYTDKRMATADGVPSGSFAQFATEQDHGAYVGMKPGQFKQFAVRVLGPTAPYYDQESGKTVRGWSGAVHQMTLSAAEKRMEELAAKPENGDETTEYNWEDF